jgi:membrane-associated phospholipid phosphatase
MVSLTLPYSARWRHALAFALVGAFLLLAHATLGGRLTLFDRAVTVHIYALRSPALTGIMEWLSFLGEQGIIIASVAICTALAAGKRWRELGTYLAIVGGNEILNLVLKLAISRPRPTFLPLVHEPGYSFPSGHAQDSVVFYGAIAYWLWRSARNKKPANAWFALAAAAALAVGLSRIYLGAHFPSDVLAGYLIGAAWLLVVLV